MEEKVEREIGHVINYGIRPQVTATGDPAFKHYKVGDRLRRVELALPVVYSTHWCGTGFGKRTLDAQELSSAFDLPLWMQPQGEDSCAEWLDSGVFGRMNPLQLFNAVLDQTLPLLSKLEKIPEAGKVSDVRPLKPLGEDYGVDLPLIGKYLVHSWVDNSLITEKAGKSDDAGVPMHLWDQRIVQVLDIPIPVINTIRKWLFTRYCRGLMRSLGACLRRWHGKDWVLELLALRRERGRTQGGFSAHLKRLRGGESFFDLCRNADAGSDLIRKNSSASWWEWNGGSALVFWQWGSLIGMTNARDGTRVYVSGELPRFRRAQQAPKSGDLEMVGSKLGNVRMKNYIRSGLVASLTHYFYVYKDYVSETEFDIRMIYDGTGCDLNAAVWAPSFWMPTVGTALRRVSFYTYCVDGDLGEMFLNFPMDPDLRPYAGVDLRTVREAIETLLDSKGGPAVVHNWERWMGAFVYGF